MVISGALGVVFLILDQLTKIWAERTLYAQFRVMEVIPDFFYLRFATNKGAAWGIFEGQMIALAVVAVLAIAGIIIFFRKITEGCPERYYSLGLVLSGIIGNAYDRIWRGHVVDFLDFVFGSYHYPTFNIADSAICIGATILIISSFIRKDLDKLKSE